VGWVVEGVCVQWWFRLDVALAGKNACKLSGVKGRGCGKSYEGGEGCGGGLQLHSDKTEVF